MLVSVTESGEVQADEKEVITNPVRWSVVIKDLAAEGTIVKTGDLIIHMECKQLEDGIMEQELAVRSADDQYQSAATKLLVARKTTAAKVSRAEQAVQDAKDDLKKYTDGEWPVKLAETDANIMVAEEELELANRTLKTMLAINQDPELGKPYSDSEIKSEQLRVKRLELNLKKAEDQKRILETYTHKRTLRDKQTAVTDAELDLETARLEAETDIRLAEGSEASAKMRLTKQQDRLKEHQEDAAKLVVRAEKPGLIVYETRRRRWDSPVTVAVGEQINSFQQLMIIPNMDTLQVETRVYEAVREQVQQGQRALIRLDAKPGEVFEGVVQKVAPLPNTQNRWLSPNVKVYNTVVTFKDKSSLAGFKPGMSAEVEIILARLDDVVSVPIAAVFAVGDETYCFRTDGKGRHEQVRVILGRTSETRAQVLDGLKEGERVLLTAPPGVQIGKKAETEAEREARIPPTTGPAAGSGGEGRRRGRERPERGPRPTTDRSATSRPARERPDRDRGGRERSSRRQGRRGRMPS
jgi:HlyD family secretion protein